MSNAIPLSTIERQVLCRSLKLLIHRSKRGKQRSAKKGWAPAPGHNDVNALTIETAAQLLTRLGRPNKEKSQ